MIDNNKLLQISSVGLACVNSNLSNITKYSWVTTAKIRVDSLLYNVFFYNDLLNPANKFSTVDVYEVDTTENQSICLTAGKSLEYKSVLNTLNNRRGL